MSFDGQEVLLSAINIDELGQYLKRKSIQEKITYILSLCPGRDSIKKALKNREVDSGYNKPKKERLL